MRVIQSVGVFSVAKIMGLIYAAMGLIIMPFLLLAAVFGSMASVKNAPLSGMFGIVFAVMAPVLYGAMGFVCGAIGAGLYNLLAKWVGGIEVSVAAMSPVPYPLQPPGISPAQTT
jgi:hypothetical protein